MLFIDPTLRPSFRRIIPAHNQTLFCCVLALTGLTLGIVTPQSRAQETAPDFATEILPLLSDRCANCHGPDEETRQADMRVDVAELVGAESQNGGLQWIVKAGDRTASELYRRLTTDDPSEKMPPPETNLPLSSEEIERLGRWIDSGAPWDQHWSLRPLIAPPPPQLAHESQAAGAHAIDRFILARLEKTGLQPASQDDPYSLIRRLTLDLTGLPPTAAEVDAFVNHPSPAAYERLVDRLLANPELGHQFAVAWLDAARYADTYGYQSDVYREVWPWRDWVVNAFNQSMPYDQFLTWQIAGDLIENPTRESRLATAFNRLHRQTNEGGSVEEEFRAEYISDRVNTLGTAVLGLTLECARCHDHKYDPISQKNYYELAAFFANIDESGLYSHFTSYVPTPVLELPSSAQEQQLQIALQRVTEAETKYAKLWKEVTESVSSAPSPSSATRDAVEPVADEIARYQFSSDGQSRSTASDIQGGPEGKWIGSPTVVANGETNWGIELDGENGFSTSAGGDWDWYQPMSISLWMRPALRHERAVIWHRSRAWTDAASCGYELLLEDGRLSAAMIHFWPGDAIRVQATERLPINQWSHVTVTSDGSGKAAGLKIYVDGTEIATTVVRDNLVRTIRGGGANELTIGNRFRDRGFKGGQVDDLRLFARDLTPAEIAHVAKRGNPSESQNFDYEADPIARIHAKDPTIRQAREDVTNQRKNLVNLRSQIRVIMSMVEQPGLHEVHILRRGQYDLLGDKIEQPTVPKTLGSWPEHAPSDRLGLAQWLTASAPETRHPLVSRVIANRMWQHFFDQGLVSTPEDFGLQGSPPTHPELLDYLAVNLIENQWDLKHLIREIVLSDAYRRSEIVPVEIRDADPENRLLARGPSVRLSFEAIRDSALAVGGLLDRSFGGPPVKPYQPAGLWEEKSGAAYHRDVGAGSHRRSLYTFWKRTSPPPSMVLFDAPGREVCAAGRTVTETPLQALVLLNDDQFVEAARGAALGVLIDSQDNEETPETSSVEVIAQRLFFRILGRPASPLQTSVLVRLVNQQLEELHKSPDSITAFLKIGDFALEKTKYANSIDPATLAAWTLAAQTLMNLDQWVSR